MGRPVRNFQSVAQLPLEARNLVSAMERQHGRQERDSKLGTTASLFGPLAVAVMNARLHADGEDFDKHSERVGRLREKTVARLARRLAPKAYMEDALDPSMLEGDEPSQAQLDALEAMLEGKPGKAVRTPPAQAFVEQAEALVTQLTDQLSDVPLSRRRGG